MGNKINVVIKNKEIVEYIYVEVVFGFFGGEGIVVFD